MKNNLLICIGVFFSLAVSRFIPHPPNFTSLIALSFYVPAIFGIKFGQDCPQKSEIEEKNCHERGRRKGVTTDDTDRHKISRRVDS